jgi:hypothetical protein
MDGEYPAAENPERNLPVRIMDRFCDEAIRIHPTWDRIHNTFFLCNLSMANYAIAFVLGKPLKP